MMTRRNTAVPYGQPPTSTRISQPFASRESPCSSPSVRKAVDVFLDSFDPLASLSPRSLFLIPAHLGDPDIAKASCHAQAQ